MLTEITLKADEEADISEVINTLNNAPKMKSVLFEITANLNKRVEWHIDARPDLEPYDVKEYIMGEIFQMLKDEGLTEKDFE